MPDVSRLTVLMASRSAPVLSWSAVVAVTRALLALHYQLIGSEPLPIKTTDEAIGIGQTEWVARCATWGRE